MLSDLQSDELDEPGALVAEPRLARGWRAVRGSVVFCVVAAGLVYGASDFVIAVTQAATTRDFGLANNLLKQYRAHRGVTPEYLEAYSWIGRGELFAKNYQAALDNAADVRQLCLQQLTGRKPDAESSLPTALGASIEVTGQALAATGRRDEAVTFMRVELEKWRSTSINARIQKNINLLSLEGKPAPALDVTRGAAGPQPRPLSAHAGHPVLLFFWAHWCSDCKQEIPIIERVQAADRAKGLEIIAPTQWYGYVAGGEDAPRAVETPYIAKIFAQYYSGLGNVETPLSNTNFERYGVSTTPTLVLVNGAGIVTLYHPGAMTFDELSAALRR
jgi:thiol-disulfide isomerase/thioredoxin